MIKFFLILNMSIVDMCIASSVEEAKSFFKEDGIVLSELEAQTELENLGWEG